MVWEWCNQATFTYLIVNKTRTNGWKLLDVYINNCMRAFHSLGQFISRSPPHTLSSEKQTHRVLCAIKPSLVGTRCFIALYNGATRREKLVYSENYLREGASRWGAVQWVEWMRCSAPLLGVSQIWYQDQDPVTRRIVLYCNRDRNAGIRRWIVCWLLLLLDRSLVKRLILFYFQARTQPSQPLFWWLKVTFQ